MEMPKEVVLLHYVPRNTFLDHKSEESGTDRVKAKYKLLFKKHKAMCVYVFFVLTTTKDACAKERRFEIYPKDWEHREGDHLHADCSYIDVQKHIVMTEDEVETKAKQGDGFSFVGKIAQSKFSDLRTLVDSYLARASQNTDYVVRDYLKIIMADPISTAFVKKFNI